MAKVRVIHDTAGQTLTVWLDDPSKEHVCEETAEEAILMKDANGRIIGFELLHYIPEEADGVLSVESIVRAAS